MTASTNQNVLRQDIAGRNDEKSDMTGIFARTDQYDIMSCALEAFVSAFER
jgi:hypothetical protein